MIIDVRTTHAVAIAVGVIVLTDHGRAEHIGRHEFKHHRGIAA
jgi:hypothetical protein